MKLTLLFLMLPFLAISATSPARPSKEPIRPESMKFGMHVKTVSSLFTKTSQISNGVTSYHLKVNTFNIGDVKMEDAFVLSERGIIESLSLVFNKANGIKFRNDMIQHYGMPPVDMVDNYEWKSENVIFEIHETETGFTATYQNVNPSSVLASF